MSEMAGGELLVVATIRDELVGPLEAIRTELGRVAAAQERVATTSTTASRGLTEEGAAAERTTTKLRAVDLANRNAARGFGVLGMSVPKTAAVIAVALAGSVYAAAKFESALTRVQTQAGASAGEVARMRGELLRLAPSVGTAPDQLAESLYHVESAGFRGAAALAAVTAAAHGAAIGNANLEDTTQAMIATLASGIKGVHGADDAMALLNRTVGIGDMRMQQLAQALATGILPSARSAGLHFNDVAAALATITDNATPANEAATRLRMTFALLSSPSRVAEKSLGTIGVTGSQLASDMRKPDGLLVALTDLQAHMRASGKTAVEQNQVLEHAFGGGRTSGAILTLLGEMDRLRSKYAELGTASQRNAEYQAAWATYTGTLSYKWHALVAGFEVGAITIGSRLEPAVKSVLDLLMSTGRAIGDVVGFFHDHQVAATALAAVLVAALVPALAATVLQLYRFVAVRAAYTFLALASTVSAAATAFTAAGGGIRGMAAALEALNLNPVMLAITAVAAATAVFWMRDRQHAQQARDAVDAWVTSLHAAPTSLASIESALSQINREGLGKVFSQDAGDPIKMVAGMKELEAQRQQLLTQAASLRANEVALGQAYGLTGTQVEQLASKYGVDLTGSVESTGKAFDAVMQSIAMSHHATRQASLDISQMSSSATSASEAVTLLRDSLDALSGNSIAADEAAIAFRDRIVALDKALRKSHGSMDLNSVAGRVARQAFDEATSSASQWTVATQQSTDSQGKAAAALKTAIGMLLPFAHGNNYAAQQVAKLRTELHNLQDAIDGLHGKTVHVNVLTSGMGGGNQVGRLQRQGIGDTAGPRGGRLGDVMGLHARLSGIPGKRTVTSHVRSWGLGSANSDHATGRAIDLVGSGLGAYQVAARRAGGFAEFHGSGEGRHLHVAAGDTPGPRPSIGPRGGDDGAMHLHVHLEAGAVVVGSPYVDLDAVASAVEAGAARGGARAINRARVGHHRFGAH